MPRKKESYEDKLLKLTDIINAMEDGDLTLDESMKKYEDGIKLCNELYKLLNAYEGKIKVLSEDKEEEFEIVE